MVDESDERERPRTDDDGYPDHSQQTDGRQTDGRPGRHTDETDGGQTANRSDTGGRTVGYEGGTHEVEDESGTNSTGQAHRRRTEQPTESDEADQADVDEENPDGKPPQSPESDSERAVSDSSLPEDVRKYEKFKKIDGSTYDRANEFLRDRTYITAREWAIARLCADFRTETGVEMTKIGENLPHLVPFMTDTYSPQAVNQARSSFEAKVRKSGATFLYGAMCDFFTAEELDDVMYEATEVAKFLLEVEGIELAVEDELDAEDRISNVMREVREHSVALRHDEVTCPECDHQFEANDTQG